MNSSLSNWDGSQTTRKEDSHQARSKLTNGAAGNTSSIRHYSPETVEPIGKDAINAYTIAGEGARTLSEGEEGEANDGDMVVDLHSTTRPMTPPERSTQLAQNTKSHYRSHVWAQSSTPSPSQTPELEIDAITRLLQSNQSSRAVSCASSQGASSSSSQVDIPVFPIHTVSKTYGNKSPLAISQATHSHPQPPPPQSRSIQQTYVQTPSRQRAYVQILSTSKSASSTHIQSRQSSSSTIAPQATPSRAHLALSTAYTTSQASQTSTFTIPSVPRPSAHSVLQPLALSFGQPSGPLAPHSATKAQCKAVSSSGSATAAEAEGEEGDGDYAIVRYGSIPSGGPSSSWTPVKFDFSPSSIATPSASREKRKRSSHSPLFTPEPECNTSRSSSPGYVNALASPTLPGRLFMSHVSVPSLRKGVKKTDYKFFTAFVRRKLQDAARKRTFISPLSPVAASAGKKKKKRRLVSDSDDEFDMPPPPSISAPTPKPAKRKPTFTVDISPLPRKKVRHSSPAPSVTGSVSGHTSASMKKVIKENMHEEVPAKPANDHSWWMIDRDDRYYVKRRKKEGVCLRSHPVCLPPSEILEADLRFVRGDTASSSDVHQLWDFEGSRKQDSYMRKPPVQSLLKPGPPRNKGKGKGRCTEEDEMYTVGGKVLFLDDHAGSLSEDEFFHVDSDIEIVERRKDKVNGRQGPSRRKRSLAPPKTGIIDSTGGQLEGVERGLGGSISRGAEQSEVVVVRKSQDTPRRRRGRPPGPRTGPIASVAAIVKREESDVVVQDARKSSFRPRGRPPRPRPSSPAATSPRKAATFVVVEPVVSNSDIASSVPSVIEGHKEQAHSEPLSPVRTVPPSPMVAVSVPSQLSSPPSTHLSPPLKLVGSSGHFAEAEREFPVTQSLRTDGQPLPSAEHTTNSETQFMNQFPHPTSPQSPITYTQAKQTMISITTTTTHTMSLATACSPEDFVLAGLRQFADQNIFLSEAGPSVFDAVLPDAYKEVEPPLFGKLDNSTVGEEDKFDSVHPSLLGDEDPLHLYSNSHSPSVSPIDPLDSSESPVVASADEAPTPVYVEPSHFFLTAESSSSSSSSDSVVPRSPLPQPVVVPDDVVNPTSLLDSEDDGAQEVTIESIDFKPEEHISSEPSDHHEAFSESAAEYLESSASEHIRARPKKVKKRNITSDDDFEMGTSIQKSSRPPKPKKVYLAVSDISDDETYEQKKKPKSATSGTGKTSGSTVQQIHLARGNWARGDSEAYCHQCRTKSFKLKMKCSCKREFCNRCIAIRYPEMEFNHSLETFKCPVCEGACNCDICCRKRGDVFISSLDMPHRLTSALPPRKRRKPLRFREVEGPMAYWAAVYDFNGRKLGSAFAEASGKDDIVLVHKVPQKRIFIGNVVPSWGLSSRTIIKDMEDAPIPTVDGSKSQRIYIGNPKKLFLPLQYDESDEDYESDDYDDISSLTSLDDETEEDDENADRHKSYDSLDDVDVTRAVTDALRSLGVATITEVAFV